MLLSDKVNSRTRYARIAVSALFFSAGFCFSSWASRIPAIQQKLQLNEAQLGLVLLSLPVGLMVSLPVSGFVVARQGSRTTSVISGLFYAAILPFLGLVSQAWQLVMVLFLFGFAGNLLNIAMNTQGVNVEEQYKRSIMASFHGVWSLAGFTGAAAGMLMVYFAAPPFVHFCISAALVWMIVLAANRFLLAQDVHSGSKAPLFAKPDKTLLKLGLIAFCCMVCEGTMFDWSGIYFSRVVQVKESFTTLGFAAFMTTMAGGRFTGDWLSVKLGRMNMIRLSGLLIASGLLLAVMLPYLVPATVGFLLTGMGVSSVVPLVYSAAGRSGKVASGVALAAVSTIGYLGFLFGPPVIGLIAEAFSLRWSFTLIALLGLSTGILARYSEIKD